MPYWHNTFHAEMADFDPSTGRGRTFPDYTYGCHAVEVEVSEDTGVVRVLRYVASHDIGRSIDPLRRWDRSRARSPRASATRSPRTSRPTTG